jgi:hypothetical protein
MIKKLLCVRYNPHTQILILDTCTFKNQLSKELSLHLNRRVSAVSFQHSCIWIFELNKLL